MANLKKKANLAFVQLLLIGAAVGVMFSWAAVIVWPKLIWLARAAWDKTDSLCGCLSHWSFFDHPYVFSLIILAGLSLAVLGLAVVAKIIKLNLSTRRFIAFNLKQSKPSLSLKLEKAAQVSGLAGRVIEIKIKEPVIFCFGFWCPQICISQGVVKKLNHQELTAVLRHEKHHLSVYEPVRLLVVKVLNQILFFVPGIKGLTANYMILSELAADEQATDGFQNKLFLARALEKMMRLKEQAVQQSSLAISFFSLIDERVNQLVEDNYRLPIKLLGLRVTMVLVLILLVGAVFYWPVSLTQSASLNHSAESCTALNKQPMNHKCEMSLLSFECRMGEGENLSSFLTCDN